MPRARALAAAAVGTVVLMGSACGGGGGDSGPEPSPLAVAKAPSESGDGQTGAAGQPLGSDLRIIITRDGSPESNTSVTWTTSSGSLDPTTSSTSPDGIAASRWTLGVNPGAQTALATVTGATGSPVTFTATATGGTPSPLVAAKAPSESGDGQTGEAGQPLGSDLRIIVTRDGSPQASVAVTWSTSSGSLDPSTGSTGPDGIAASRWTLGANPGAQTALATVTGATGSPVTFTATATGGTPPPPPPTSVAVTVGNIFFRSVRNATANPAVDTVAVNGTVTWTWVNTGSTPHSVRSLPPPAFTSSTLKTGDGETYQFTFTQAGTYNYNCVEHGNQMTGRIVVR